MADGQQDVVAIPPVSGSEASSDDDQQMESGESASDSDDATNDVDLKHFSEKTSTNDTALVVEGERIYVSKHVLSLVSPVFRAMFELDMVEKNMDEIPLPGKRRSDVIEFLLCVYPDTRKPITEKNICVLLPLFTEYQLDKLKADCEETLIKSCADNTDIDTLFERLILSLTYSMGDLRIRCIQLASTRNTDTLREAMRKYALPDDVKIELLENAMKVRDSEIQSLIEMNNMLPLDEQEQYDMNRDTFSVTVSTQLRHTRYHFFPKYIRGIQTAIDHKLNKVEYILLKMFAADMNKTKQRNTVLEMSKLPQNIKDELFIEYGTVQLVHKSHHCLHSGK